LDFIGQFTTDIRHVSGNENVVADALSRVEEIRYPLDYTALAASQEADEQIKEYEGPESSLRLRRINVPDMGVAILCDVAEATPRSFLTEAFRRVAFDSIHNLAHPGINTTVKLIDKRYVWPSMRKNCRNWARMFVPCQRAKITRQVAAPIGKFTPPSRRFEHIHLDIIVMPSSEGKRYCLTCVDRFTHWPETFPIEDQEAATVARAFYEGWICRFGTSLRVTTDQGR